MSPPPMVAANAIGCMPEKSTAVPPLPTTVRTVPAPPVTVADTVPAEVPVLAEPPAFTPLAFQVPTTQPVAPATPAGVATGRDPLALPDTAADPVVEGVPEREPHPATARVRLRPAAARSALRVIRIGHPPVGVAR